MIPPFAFSRDESNGAPESHPSSVFDSPRAMMNGVTPEMESRYYEQLVGNVTTLTREFFNRLADPRRDLDKECGFPRQMDAEQYWNLYNRNSFASRVVETIPLAVWKGNPEVYEDEDADEETEFEAAWRQMNADLRGERSFFQDEEGSPFWDCLKRADILSGVGQYGVILLGFDDGLDLRDPVDGVEELNSMPKPYAKRKKSGDEEEDAPKLNPREKAEKRASKRKAITENRRYKLVWNAKGGSYGPPPNTYTGVPGDEYALREDEGEADKEPEEDALPFDEDQRGTGDDESADPSLQEEETAWEPKVRLLYMRAFPEVMAQVATYETNPTSLRYGQPTSYTISFHDPREVGSAGAQPPSHTRVVHWTRVIHVNLEGLSSETYGVERMRQVYRNLLSIEKLVYASPEMFYKGAFPGISFESHPQLGGQVQYDKAAMKRMMEDYQNGLQRYLLTSGGAAKMLAPAVADPTPHVNVQVEAICVRIGIPVPVFKGYEIGEQASQNNTKDWDDKVKGWRETNRTPRLIVPIVDRLINVGVLPEPTGYSVQWPEVSQQSATERAQVISTLTQAMVSYVSGNVAQFMPPMEYLTRIWEMTTEEAESIVEAAEKVLEEQKAEQEAQLAEFGAPQFGPDGQPVPQPEVGPDGEPVEDDPFAPAEESPVSEEEEVQNAFCPTGDGGGVDPSCPSKEGRSVSESPQYSDISKLGFGFHDNVSVKVYRGQSRSGDGQGMSALGSGRYYGLDQEVADRFSKPGTVKEHTFKLDSVLVITSDEDMENVKKQAEEDTGHDFGKKGNNYNGFLFGDQPAQFSKWAKAQGLTALITTYKEAPGGRQVLVF